MQYLVEHKTEYRYLAPISESQMEARMMPRSLGHQRCWRFRLATTPRSNVKRHLDHLGNTIHHFDVPRKHDRLVIQAESLVQVDPPPVVPEFHPDGRAAWDALDQIERDGEFWDELAPSKFCRVTPILRKLADEWRVDRREDPLVLLRELNQTIYRSFDYVPRSTKVDSPIDHALTQRRGVCQDFAHIMISLARMVKIPCRYVSGYLYHRREDHDRSQADATHAWVEAFLPGLGWVGFDPTNNLVVGNRHICVAVGRDYADVPPTRGTFRGDAETELRVEVKVEPSDALVLTFEDDWERDNSAAAFAEYDAAASSIREQQQQQQQ